MHEYRSLVPEPKVCFVCVVRVDIVSIFSVTDHHCECSRRVRSSRGVAGVRAQVAGEL
jgi:hypothetical protein